MKMARLRTWKGLSILVALALVLALGAVAVLTAGKAEATLLPAEVWVDDSWCCQADVDLFDPSLTWQYDAFNKVQDGIDAVAEGGTVHVRAGKYTETVGIGKSLTLQSTDGWQNTRIDPPVDMGILIWPGHMDVTVQGFEITDGGYGIYMGAVASAVDVKNCFIHDNLFDGIHTGYTGDLLHIEGNIISQNGLASNGCGVHMNQAWNTTNIRDNIIGAWWDGEEEGTIYAGNDGDGLRIDNVPAESDVAIWRNLIAENGDNGVNFLPVTSVHGSVSIGENAIGAWPCYYEGAGTHNFAGNKNHGIHIGEVSDTGTVNIEGNAMSENGDDGIDFGQGAGAIFGSVAIKGNLIGGWTCYPGDYSYSGDLQRYSGNGGEGIYIWQVGESGRVTIEGNKISENALSTGDTGMWISDIYGEVTIADNDVGAWKDSHGNSYRGNRDQGILVSNVYSGGKLTIGPDNSIKENTGDGIEIQWGQASSDIEIHHNQIDANGGKDEVKPEGLEQIIIEGCGIKLGSGGVCGAMVSDNIVTNHHEGVHVDENSRNTTIQNNEIRDNDHGVWVEGDDNQILRNDILNNKMMDSGIHLTETAEGNIIHCNNIVGNWPYGVCNENADEAVNATGNWWGCIEGPGATGCDLVFGNVIYDPWLLDEFQYCRECGGAPRPSPAVPTVNQWGIVAMITLFGGLLVWAVRRRQTISLKG
jgi:parallel beta-helix repeat protein